MDWRELKAILEDIEHETTEESIGQVVRLHVDYDGSDEEAGAKFLEELQDWLDDHVSKYVTYADIIEHDIVRESVLSESERDSIAVVREFHESGILNNKYDHELLAFLLDDNQLTRVLADKFQVSPEELKDTGSSAHAKAEQYIAENGDALRKFLLEPEYRDRFISEDLYCKLKSGHFFVNTFNYF